jgi:hypothetical protein
MESNGGYWRVLDSTGLETPFCVFAAVTNFFNSNVGYVRDKIDFWNFVFFNFVIFFKKTLTEFLTRRSDRSEPRSSFEFLSTDKGSSSLLLIPNEALIFLKLLET